MATANSADDWRQRGASPGRPAAGARAPWPDRGAGAERSSRPIRTGPARPARPADRLRAAEARNRDAAEYSRTPAPRRTPEPGRATGRPERGRFEDSRFEGRRPQERRPEARRPQERRPDDRRPTGRPAEPRGAAVSARPRDEAAAAGGGRVRGVVAVLGMFVVTLAGAGIDSFVGIGLGLVTLGALVAVTAIAALVVRRRDLVSVLVAPPLVFVAVAGANIGLAPSASFNLPTVATLLVRGFPTMAVATGVALVLTLIRLAARR